MDLTIKLDEGVLNLRVVVIMKTKKGFVFEKSKSISGFFFCLGGRVKLGESSLAAAKRETFEETGLQIENFKFVTIIENFFVNTIENINKGLAEKIHEINFVYTVEINSELAPEFNLHELQPSELKYLDIRPEIIKKIISENLLNEARNFIV